MGVVVREKVKGSGKWWIFIHYKGKRHNRMVGSEKAAKEVADQIQARLTLGKGAFPEKVKPPAPTLKRYFKRFEENYKGT